MPTDACSNPAHSTSDNCLFLTSCKSVIKHVRGHVMLDFWDDVCDLSEKREDEFILPYSDVEGENAKVIY